MAAYGKLPDHSPQLVEYFSRQKYQIAEGRLEIWVPHESHVAMYAVQCGHLETFLRRHLEREDIRVQLLAKPDAFPEIQEVVHTSEERWNYLRKINPLVEVLRLQAQGKVLPQEVEVPLPDEEQPDAK